jgi:hypothetical protein
VRVHRQVHFAHADGTPFLPVGTPCHAWAHQHADLPGRTGAPFEMADRRNGSHASFKTYVGVLRDLWPYTVAARAARASTSWVIAAARAARRSRTLSRRPPARWTRAAPARA